jgi:hypothetical protein
MDKEDISSRRTENPKRPEHDRKGKNPFSLFSTDWKYNVVKNAEAPELYSRQAIYFFTVFCSVFTGGTLMFLNLWKLKDRKGASAVAAYSMIYGAVTLLILLQLKRNVVLAMIAGLIGSFPLCNYYWEKFVGKYTGYRTKSILIPLIVVIVIFVGLLVAAMIHPEAFAG